MSKPAGFADLADFDEDSRIQIMGEMAEKGKVIGCVVDAQEKKVKRYIEKMTKRFSKVELKERFDGPVKGTVTLKFALKKEFEA